MPAPTLVDIAVTIQHRTERAVLVYDGATSAWLPLSQVELHDMEVGDTGEVTLPEWLAKEKELI